MRLTCPNCDTQYEVDSSMIPPSGRDVQCSNCGWTWFQEAQQAAEVVQVELAEAVPPGEGRSGSGLDEQAAEFFERRPAMATAGDADNGLEPAGAFQDDDSPSEGGMVQSQGATDLIRQFSEQDPNEITDEEPEVEAADLIRREHDSSVPPALEKEPEAEDDVEAPLEEDEALKADAVESEDSEDYAAEPEVAVEEDAAEAQEDDSQEPEDDAVEAQEDDAREPEDDAVAAQVEEDAPVAEAASEDREGEANEKPEFNARPRPIDTHVLGILRAEAEREIAQRRAEETASLETQPELGLADPSREGSMELGDRLARLRGEDIDGFTDTPAREELPDVEDINASLTSTSDRAAEDVVPVPAGDVLRRRAGFRLGFAGVMIAVVGVILVYLNAPQIAQAVPALEPALASYVEWANSVRLGLDSLLSQTVDRITGGPQSAG
ncbi:MAG: zinc-ribbon domain-containing protein [Pseudomonadota bacterium]